MRTILLLTLVTGLFNCTRTTETKNSGVPSDSLEFSAQDDYTASTIYRSLDSDSLLIDKETVDNFLLHFITNGQLLRRHEYGGGDCDGVYRTYNLDKNTIILTVDKYDCGDYGFGNNQYLTKNDSVILVREFTVDWDISDTKTPYRVTERMIKFTNGKTISKERQKSTDRLSDIGFSNLPFNNNENSQVDEYTRIRKELVDKGRIEQ